VVLDFEECLLAVTSKFHLAHSVAVVYDNEGGGILKLLYMLNAMLDVCNLVVLAKLPDLLIFFDVVLCLDPLMVSTWSQEVEYFRLFRVDVKGVLLF